MIILSIRSITTKKVKSNLEKIRFSKLLYRNDKIDFIEYTVNVRLAKLSKLQYISSRV